MACAYFGPGGAGHGEEDVCFDASFAYDRFILAWTGGRRLPEIPHAPEPGRRDHLEADADEVSVA